MNSSSPVEIVNKSLEPKSIYHYDKIKSVLNHCEYNTFVVFDLDNTLIESTQELGSDQWFAKFMEQACRLSPTKETIDLVVNIYSAVQHHAEMQAVEEYSVQLVRVLQALNIPVMALTARGSEILIPTVNQLKSLDICFDKQWKNAEFPLVLAGQKKQAYFKNGILFCSGADKGKCLRAFLEYFSEEPKHVLMVDDKEKHLKSVQKVIEDYKGKFTGIRYSYLDEKIKQVNMGLADQQMAKIVHHLPSETKEAIQKIGLNKLPNPHQGEQPQEMPAKSLQDKESLLKVRHPFFSNNKVMVRRNSCPDIVSMAQQHRDV